MNRKGINRGNGGRDRGCDQGRGQAHAQARSTRHGREKRVENLTRQVIITGKDEDLTKRFKSNRFNFRKSLDYYSQQLFEKRGSKREEALASIIEAFTNDLQCQFAQEKFATLLDRFLKSVESGSPKEIDLACRAIGLLVLTNPNMDNAHEAYEECLPRFSHLLTSDILQSFQDVKEGKVSSLAEAICVWSFLLSTLEGWDLNYKHWRGANSKFLSLLEDENILVQFAAKQALSMVFEKGCVQKFSDNSDFELEHLYQLKNTFIENNPEKSMMVGGCPLKIANKSELLQLEFFKHVLGDGFSLHMMQNENLSHKFEFESVEEFISDNELSQPEIQEVHVQYFEPTVRNKGCKQEKKWVLEDDE
ncbi:Interferon-related developmental regulator, N-terminal [Dillenia turbinata]|uniref:Interferon-related developmental regulator, N-terminal n=1 Tax=Dillenia turbinata TaxID=194707 RepID=A0AAN8WBM5_9MAGN